MDAPGERKERHLAICVDPASYRVETRAGGAGLGRLALAHRSLPELSLDALDSTADFLGARLSMPLLVSCMTGGSEGGGRVNRGLARVAGRAGIAFGLGSFRPLLDDPSRIEDFRVKALLGPLPLLANIGAVVLRERGARPILELAKRLEADALVVHLNPGQELFQEGGDRDFRGLRAAIAGLCRVSGLPVIVKETGFGIAPAEVAALLGEGVAWVDLAGAGGTNWAAVEAWRLGEGPLRDAAADFDDWGHPTALLLASLAEAGLGGGAEGLRVIASGGIRNGVEVAKCLALGAGMAAMALPLVRAFAAGGEEGAERYLERVRQGLRAAMLLTGSARVAELRRGILLADPGFLAEARALAALG